MSNSSDLNLKKPLFSLKKRLYITHLTVILLLILMIAIGAIPGYLSGKWSWKDLPKVANITPLKNIRQQGIDVTGWKTLAQKEILLGGNQWSIQMIAKGDETPVTVLLMPQDYYLNKPEIEWTDVNALKHWRIDSLTTLKFTAKNSTEQVPYPSQEQSSQVIARFFRGWQQTTSAVVQWYAWPGGGHYSPSTWFWLDQWAQLHQRRVPWVAVSLEIPINPLSDLKANQQAAVSLAQTVQTTLEDKIFSLEKTNPQKHK